MVDLLHVLAVVALLVGEAEEPLLEPVVLPVPHRDREVEEAVAVADAGDAVLEREAARVALGPVPAPRPELLERVLEGLRDLPTAVPFARDDTTGEGGDPGLPLPRRRS